MPIDPSRLVDHWFQAAEQNFDATERDTSVLFNVTNQTVNDLKELQVTEKKQAEEFADVILQSFANHGIDESKLLAQWMGAENGEAYKSLHHLFETIAEIKNCPDAFEKGIDSPDDVALPLIGLIHIDSAVRKHREYTIRGKLGNNNDIMNAIIRKNVLQQDLEEMSALELTSKTTQIQVAHAYRGPLKDRKISTAGQAIEYAKKYGKGLRYIDISNIHFSAAQLKELISHLPAINALIAADCGIDEYGVQALARSENLKNIKTLNLNNNKIIGERGAIALAGSEYLKNIKDLDLGANFIEAAGAESLVRSENLKNIKTLNLSVNDIGDRGAIALAGSQYLKNIKDLGLNFNKITDRGLIALVGSENLKNIKRLYLVENLIGNDGAKAFLDPENLKNIKKVDLSYNNKIEKDIKIDLQNSAFKRNINIILESV